MKISVDVEKKVSRLWINNTSGKPDAALTLLVVSFILSCVLAIVGAVDEVSIGSTIIDFNEFNVGGFATTVMLPLAGLYWGRRFTESMNAVSKAQSYYSPGSKQESSIEPRKKEVKAVVKSSKEESDEAMGDSDEVAG